MTMEDIAKEVNCKHIRIESSWHIYPFDLTFWFVCGLTGESTDEKKCSNCKDRKPRRSK